MERIKQALDKARAENIASSSVPVSSEGVGALRPPSQTESGIQYSQTQICSLDSHWLRENRIICDDQEREALAAYKMLRTQVLQRMVSRGWNALAISSPTQGDGKTLTAINLAISLARELHHTVLLVDLDLRNPSIHKYFGIQPKQGIDDYLLKGVPLEDILINPGIERLVILPARTSVGISSEILASPSMGKLVQELKNRYPSRFVLFDLPPILSADDALAFAPHIDTLLLVLRDGKTTKEELQHALEILRDVPILGTLLNASEDKTAAYY